MDLNETFRKESLALDLQLGHLDPRWPSQLLGASQNKSSYNLSNMTNTEVKLGVMVAGSQPERILRTLARQTISHVRWS